MTILKLPLQSPPPATIASIPLVSSWALVDIGLEPGLLTDGGQTSKAVMMMAILLCFPVWTGPRGFLAP